MREPDSLFPKRLSLLLGLVAGALGIACEDGGTNPAPNAAPIAITPVASATPVPCPGPLPADSTSHGLVPPISTFLWASGFCNFMIPEYHDEQRLSDGDTDYGPIAYSFAFPGTALPQDHKAFDQGYVSVGVVYVAGPTNAPTYTQLNLHDGFNCMYIYHYHYGLMGIKKRWQAAIGPPTAGTCSGGNTQPVAIRPNQPSTDPKDYPPVTRFSEAPGRRPMIGVRCGNVWCIVGAHGQSDIIPPAHQGLPGAGTSPKWIVKGWFDDQTLGVLEGAGGIKPRFRMSIVPHDNLGSYNTSTFLSNWTPVATILIPKGAQIPPKYSGTAPGFAFADGKNVIEIRAQQAGARLVWTARVINDLYPTGFVYNREVDRTDHSAFGLPVPATARWRWKDQDEDLWVRCDIGCCLVQGGF